MLDLSDYGIGSLIGPSLLELQYLEHLDLSFNYFTQIPKFIDSFQRLKYLSLSRSPLSGTIPTQLGNLTKLQYLSLGYYYGDDSSRMIVDNLEWLSHLPSLTTFTLGYANFTKHGLQSFKMPPSLSSLILEGCQFPEVQSTSSLFSANSSNSLTNLELRSNTIHPTVLTWLFNSSANLVNLTIVDNFIDSSLPNSVQKMSSLVGSAVPNSLGNLTKLKTLDLSYNNFNGSLQDVLKSLSGCSRKYLEILSLGGNKLRGSILDDDKTFLSLRELYLFDNLLEGLSPNCSSRFPNLVVFQLDDNQLTELPDFTTLPSLREFYAFNNRLNGSLPESIGQLHNLEILDLHSNSLSGVVSEVHFQKLLNLKELDLSSNSLTLSFNSNWVPHFQLNILSLSSCKLGPQFPRWLHNQLNLSRLVISNSGISGAIPSWFSEQTLKLEYLDLSSNLLNSTLPNLLMMSNNHPEVNLSYNEFQGSLPISLSNASKLYLSNNKLSGLRSFLCDQKNGATRILDLSNNMLSGSLPNCRWNFNSLGVLILQNNALSGKIPSSISFLHWLSYLNLRNNSFSGSFPSSLKNCTNMQVLDVGKNNLIGEIPSWIGESLMNLVFLSLKANRFYGTIPSTICKLQFLQIMDPIY